MNLLVFAAVPANPSNVAISAAENNQITLTWTAPVVDADSYTVYWTDDATVESSFVISDPATATYTIPNLIGDMTYSNIKVTATNSVDGESDKASATSLSQLTKPDTVAGLAVT